MTRHDAVKALNIYKRAGQQVSRAQLKFLLEYIKLIFIDVKLCLLMCFLCIGWKSSWVLWLLQRARASKELSVPNIKTGWFLAFCILMCVSLLTLSKKNWLQPPPSFLATMEEYIKEAPQSGSVQKKLVKHEFHLIIFSIHLNNLHIVWHFGLLVLTGVWGKRGGTRTTRRRTAWRTCRRWRPKGERGKWSAAYRRRARGASRGERRGRT